MDKLKKQKHDHKLTDWLKFGIFAIIMLAPFFSIGGRMAYTIFNKNAYESYSGNNGNTFTEVTPTSYKNGTKYTMSIQTDNLLSTGVLISLYDNIEMIQGTNTTIAENINQNCTTLFVTNNTTNNMYISFRDINDNTIVNINVKAGLVIFTFTSSYYTGPINELLPFLTYREYNQNYNLDNAFDYSISKIADEPIFNWVKNTAIYDGINAMFTGLEYDTDSNPIAIMCAYWLLNTAVYIVIDIVIWAFTKMTHMFVQE